MKTIILTGISRGLGKSFFDLLLTTPIKLVAIGRTFPPIDDVLLKNQVSLLHQDLSAMESFDTEAGKINRYPY